MKSLKTWIRDCNARAFFEKNQHRESDWTNSRFKGGPGKKEGVVLLRERRGGWHPNAHYVEKYILNITNLFLLKEIQYASKLLELI